MFYLQEKQGIRIFSETLENLHEIAEARGIEFVEDNVHQTGLEIVHGYNTRLTGLYYIKGDEPQQPLDEAKDAKIAEINNIYEEKAAAIKIDTPESEVLTWNIQEAEAVAWEKDNAKPTPFCDGLAVAREIDRIVLLNKVLEKVKTFKAYMASLTGTRQKYEDRVKMAQTVDDVGAVVWPS